jgi:hypothetical protein
LKTSYKKYAIFFSSTHPIDMLTLLECNAFNYKWRYAMKPSSASVSSQKRSTRKAAELQASSGLPPLDPALRHQMIATAAYYRAERLGFDACDPDNNWFVAEMEVDQLLQSPLGDTDANNDHIARLEALLTEWDGQFAELKDKVLKAKAKTRAEYQKQLQVVTDKRALISDKLKDLQQHTGQVWDDLKNTIESAWQEIRQETDHITSRFMHEEPSTDKEKKTGKSEK